MHWIKDNRQDDREDDRLEERCDEQVAEVERDGCECHQKNQRRSAFGHVTASEQPHLRGADSGEKES